MSTIIANPIYDIVFKYLLEDLDIAKGLLSLILDTEIVELSLQPQETTSEYVTNYNKPIRIYRVDFVALVKQADGSLKKILIELQKTKRDGTITRFRGYLAQAYYKEDTITDNKIEAKQPLEIVAIYLLGFPLNMVDSIVLHSKPCFHDVLNNKPDTKAHLEDFVKLLTHESYFIQIPKLIEPTKTRLEHILSVFNQQFKSNDEHALYYEVVVDDPLLQKVLHRLTRAIADEEVRRKMDLEDELEHEFNEYQTTIEQKDSELKMKNEQLEQKNQQLKETKQVIEQKDQQLEETKQVIEQKDQLLEQSRLLIEELKRKLAEKDIE